jgi:hypothetical protein
MPPPAASGMNADELSCAMALQNSGRCLSPRVTLSSTSSSTERLMAVNS